MEHFLEGIAPYLARIKCNRIKIGLGRLSHDI